MSTEKAEALVIRLADFSESSKVVTLFTRQFGKVAGLAKGAKRLRGPFEAALDLLSECRLVFIRKSSGALDLLTEAQLIRRFTPAARDLNSLYGGYYVAELLDGLTEVHDPHPHLYDAAIQALARLGTDGVDSRIVLLRFELRVLMEIGQLPDFETCSVCQQPVVEGQAARYWVSQGSLLCSNCGRPEYQRTEVHPGTIARLRDLLEDEDPSVTLEITPQQFRELRHLVTAAICHAMDRKPKMLAMLKF